MTLSCRMILQFSFLCSTLPFPSQSADVSSLSKQLSKQSTNLSSAMHLKSFPQDLSKTTGVRSSASFPEFSLINSVPSESKTIDVLPTLSADISTNFSRLIQPAKSDGQSSSYFVINDTIRLKPSSSSNNQHSFNLLHLYASMPTSSPYYSEKRLSRLPVMFDKSEGVGQLFASERSSVDKLSTRNQSSTRHQLKSVEATLLKSLGLQSRPSTTSGVKSSIPDYMVKLYGRQFSRRSNDVSVDSPFFNALSTANTQANTVRSFHDVGKKT